MASLSERWSAGEVGAKEVYRQSLTGFFVVLALSITLLSIPAFRAWYIILAMIWLSGRAFIERRRALIFTDGALLYRPALSTPVRVNLADVISVEQCTVGAAFALRIRAFKGLCFHLKSGEVVRIPLDFPHSRLISERLLLLQK